MRKIIFFELNEVPFKVIDAFCRWRPDSTLTHYLKSCHQFETCAADKGHLSPWKTWPTVHRGINDERHMIHDFGQDLSEINKVYPSLWEILVKNNITVGVFGSLHSYPIPENFNTYSFYLPDTFAATPEAHPELLSKFQTLNLKMARESARNISTRIPWKSAIEFAINMSKLGIKARTLKDAGNQIISECAQSWRKTRRRTYQSVLSFDIFLRQLQTSKPAFVTFFTNHVASAMHRYWAATFPNDYENLQYEEGWLRTYRKEIEFTMCRFDDFLKQLIDFVDENEEYQLWIISSMGQAAVESSALETQLYLTDISSFMEALGFNKTDWMIRPAMLPQCNLVIPQEKRANFRDKLSSLKIDDQPLSFREAADGFFSIDFGHPNLHDKPAFADLGERKLSFKTLGLEMVNIEDKSGCSAYHIPEGSLIIYDPINVAPADNSRKKISTLEIAPTILNNFAVKPPSYMERPIECFLK